MARTKREADLVFKCVDGCECMPWHVDGRFNAEGRFEPYDDDDAYCPHCGSDGEPTDNDVEVAYR